VKTVISIGIGYALCFVLFQFIAGPVLLWIQHLFAIQPGVNWSRKKWFCGIVASLSALVTYPAAALIAQSVRAVPLGRGWSIALWLIGGISLLGFCLGFLSDWIANFVEQDVEQGEYRSTFGQLVIDTLLIALSLSLYICMLISYVLTDNIAVRAFSRMAQWLADVPVVGWIFSLVGFLFVLVTLKEVVARTVALVSRETKTI